MSSTPLFVTGRQHRPVLNAIGRTLIGAILFNALGTALFWQCRVHQVQ
ncbi:hypothetical protein [Roseateles sp. LKC17W]|uniref:Uncharacterized protein n=1 Tax=Pelomonas margarita TaxID=3299031 RepID=A0ABW7FQ33_9BURK